MSKSPLIYDKGRNVEDEDIPQAAEGWMQSLLIGRYVHDQGDDLDDTPRRRIVLMIVFISFLFALLMFKLISTGLFSADRYQALANGNRIREIVEYAPRGQIKDINGVVLAENTLSFQLSAIPFLTEREEGELKRDINKVASIVGVKPASVSGTLNEEGEEFGQPVVIAERLNHKQALRLEAVTNDLKGFSVDEVPVREYKSNAGIAHIVGYTGRVSKEDLKADKKDKLLLTDFIGKDGIEKSYDNHLRGENGWVRLEVDALGRPVRILGKKDPKPGEDLTLSLDYGFQVATAQALEEQMKKARSTKASAVAVDPRDGAIRAMVSVPYYNNNLFAKGIQPKQYNALVNNPNQPLFNKVTSGGYTTGSIIKPLVASAGLQEGVVNDKTIIVDRGYIDVVSQYQPGQFFRFRGWNPAGLGPMDVRKAIAWSSNIYFFTVGGGFGEIEGLGEERLTSYYRHFGLGENTGIDIPSELPGRVPDDAWKQANKGEQWFVGDTYNISIGQGDMLVSPLQITLAEASIANNGYLLQPTFSSSGKRVVRRELDIDKSNLQIVREGMREVLTSGSTAESLFTNAQGANIAGKSGTAETNTPAGERPHAWYTAFGPYESPEVMLSVHLDHGGEGTKHAAPVAGKMMQYYFGE